MKSFPSLTASTFGLVTLAAGLSAQTVETATNVASFARQPNASAFQYVKSATPVRLPFTVNAQLRQATATTYVTAARSATSSSIYMQEVAQCLSANSSAGTSASDNPQTFTPGAHDIVVKYAAQRGAKFQVVASLKGDLVGTAAMTGGVDVDNDGTVEWSAKAAPTPSTMRWQLTAGANGLAIRLRSEGLAQTGASGTSSYNATLQLEIIPAAGGSRCTFARLGNGCGPVLTPRELNEARGDVLAYETTNATAGGVAIFLLGARPVNVQFPGTRCFLYAPPEIMIGRVVSPRGTASIRFDIPKAFEGKFISQDVILFRDHMGIGVQSTNGIGVVCVKG